MTSRVDAPRAGATAALAAFAVEVRTSTLERTTSEHVKQAVLDSIGIALRARLECETSGAVARAVEGLNGFGRWTAAGYGGLCTAIGYGGAFGPHYAALLNGCNFHALDFDDTHEAASSHPGAPVIAAVLAEGERLRCAGSQLIAAVVAGYDVAVRVALASNPRAHYARGFHPTATAGVFGATAAIANLNRLPATLLEGAFGINLSQAAGSLQFAVDGAQTKPLQVGLAAHNAILALRFAVAGVRGPAEAMEGRSGFLHAYSDGARAADVMETWDGMHEIDRTAFKSYPCCRYTHSAIDQLRDIMREHRLDASSIERIAIALPAAGMRLCAYPEEVKRHPRSVVDAQFSMYYAAAATALHGSVRWDDYAHIADPGIAALIERIEVFEDPAVEALAPHMASLVDVRSDEGRERRIAVSPRGEPDRPLEWDEIVDKFHELSGVAYDRERRNRILALVRNLEGVDDIGVLMTELKEP